MNKIELLFLRGANKPSYLYPANNVTRDIMKHIESEDAAYTFGYDQEFMINNQYLIEAHGCIIPPTIKDVPKISY